MDWVELVLPAGPLAGEIAALLVDEGVAAAGAMVRGEEVVFWAPAGEAETALAALRAAAARLATAGFALGPARAQPALPEAAWRDAWKRHFHVDRVTPRIVIVPSWEHHEPRSGDVVLDLDPGRAFGTGAHASTRLVLHELDALAAAGHRVRAFLDVGTGSGILAIAAAKLWPEARGRALDVDPLAVEAARENLVRNGVDDRVLAGDDDVAQVTGRFDAVLANIQAEVIEALRPTLVARLAPGGALILSGLLAPQAPVLAEVFARAGLEVIRTRTLPDDPGWSAVTLVRP